MLIWRTSDCPLPMSPLPIASNGSTYSKPSAVHESPMGAGTPRVGADEPAGVREPEVVPELVREHAHGEVAVDPDVLAADLGDPGDAGARTARRGKTRTMCW